VPDLVTEDLDALTAEETSPGADSVRGCRCAALPDEAMNELVDGLPESGAFVVGLVRVADEQELRAGRRHMLADVGGGYDPVLAYGRQVGRRRGPARPRRTATANRPPQG